MYYKKTYQDYYVKDFLQEKADMEYRKGGELYERIKNAFDNHITVNKVGCWIWDREDLIFQTPDTAEFYARKIAYNYYVDTLYVGQFLMMACGDEQCVNPDHMLVMECECDQSTT